MVPVSLIWIHSISVTPYSWIALKFGESIIRMHWQIFYLVIGALPHIILGRFGNFSQNHQFKNFAKVSCYTVYHVGNIQFLTIFQV